MATFREISANDIKSKRSFLTQLVDVIQEDVSSSASRRKYQLFISGGAGPGITSSLFQTIYDQNYTLQTANPIFDMTIGILMTSSIVNQISSGIDAAGKILFPSKSLMMREKIDTYRQFAQTLLGSVDSYFIAPFDSNNNGDTIEAAMFMCFKRLFARDGIKRETFAMRFYESASRGDIGYEAIHADNVGENLIKPTESGSRVYTDAGAASNKLTAVGGQVSNIVDSANTNRTVGLMFNDYGVAVFDLEKILSSTQHVSGVIDAVVASSKGTSAGKHVIGSYCAENPKAKFVPDFIVSASMDNIIDHLCGTRFSSGSLTAVTFQNVTQINSTLVYCRAASDEFNYSSNPTYIDSNNRIRVIDEGQEDSQRSFVFVTGVGLYDSSDNLLAMAKLSRPIEKSDERDLSIRIRIDF